MRIWSAFSQAVWKIMLAWFNRSLERRERGVMATDIKRTNVARRFTPRVAHALTCGAARRRDAARPERVA